MNTGEEEASNNLDCLCKEEIPDVIPSPGEKIETNNDNNRDSDQLIRRLLYDAGADAVCKFGNGESFRVNKSLLAFYSPTFNETFFGESPTTTLKIEDFDCETFRTFLDCLFGLKEYTVLDALLIYPIAHCYKVRKSFKKCSNVLIPNERNENVCLAFNLATFYNDSDLEYYIISFLNRNANFFNILEIDCYRNLLEPSSICRIIQEVKMNSYLWKKIYQWGEFYLKNRKPDNNIRMLFEENEILFQLSLKDFESAASITDFHNFSNRELLDPNEILNFFNDNVFKGKGLPNESSWSYFEKGEEIVEIIKFERSFRTSRNKAPNDLTISVSTNTIYCDEFGSVKCALRYYYKKNSSETASYSYSSRIDLTPDPVTDLYRRDKMVFNRRIFFTDVDGNEVVIPQVEITYQFLGDCTDVLRTSLNNKNLKSCQMCFTENVKWEGRKRSRSK